MPARRSRTLHWRSCLEQVLQRNGAIEIAVARTYSEGEGGKHLIWRVRLLELSDSRLVVEQPTTLGQLIPLRKGVGLVGILSVGQNRWMFHTENMGEVKHQLNGSRTIPGLALTLPEAVERCQRRDYYRVDTAALSLPEVELWPLLDPKSVVLAERAAELEFEWLQTADKGGDVEPPPKFNEEEMMPEVGPRFTSLLLNIGGGGVGLHVPPEHNQILSRHKLFWIQFSLMEPGSPICASVKLAHTHLQADHHMYAGMAFDFTFNAGHKRFVVDQICRYIAIQQRMQLQRQMLDEDNRRSA